MGNPRADCSNPGMPTVLVVLADGFEEIEAIAPIDLLRRAGAEVTIATLNASIHVRGRCGVIVHADTLLATTDGKLFDCVVLPGGPGTALLRADPRVHALVQRHNEAGRWIAAICAAPTVLKDAGVLKGKRFTAHPSVAGELPDTRHGERLVVDGNLITSRGAGTAVEFGLHLVEVLFSPSLRTNVAEAICT
jgi:protein deglycase